MRFCPRCGSRYEHERFCPEDGAPTEALPEAGPSKDVLLGTLVDGRYRIDAQIGEGGMGVVYKATHIALNKTLALKILRGEVAKEPEAVQRFMQEAQAATSIGHENIIDIHDSGQLPDGTAYFVMEFLSGHPLNDMIKRGGSIPTRDALHILRQIASALGAAHARGIVHRDLKPDNVFLVKRGELDNFVKVLDFGIAKVGTSKNRLTRTGMVFGTPHYMSPEQAAGQGVDARTDIYALGVIMYEMFTGRVPFDADTFMGVLTKHMFEKPAPMSDGNSERQLGALEQITMRALEKKPENRYESMDALVADLDRVSGGGRPRSVGAQRPSAELADALEPRSKSELHLEQQQQADAQHPSTSYSEPVLPIGPRWPWFLGGAAALVAIVGLALALRGGSPTPVAPPPLAGLPAVTPPPVLPNSESKPRPSHEPAPLPKPAHISLRSEPSGAEIVIDGAIVGRTPAALPRPEAGERTVELRLLGYSPHALKLRSDSPSTLDVSLHKHAEASQAKPATKGARKAKAAHPAAPAKRRRLSSEVVDPWSD
ncbi:MAG: Serine/threonine protein kinase PrkC, regulator of stationary phase [Myxococcaceae bacterium]|nr:Serine/threonine protein kinase PrkC, regulator of stationary phase [Myxococcaceae bacterium]